LSKKVIKKYNYIGDGVESISRDSNVIKGGDFMPPDFDQFDPFLAKVQKKNAIKPAIRNAPLQTAVTNNRMIPVDLPGQAVSQPEATADGMATKSQAVAIDDPKAIENELQVLFAAQLSDAKKQAYDSGFREGKNSATSEAKKFQNQALQILNGMKSELEKQRDKFFEEIGQVAMDMSVHLAKKIIGDAVTMMPEVIKTNVDKCVGLLAGSGTVQIKINPADYDILKSYLPELEQKQEGKYSFVLEPDSKIERGGCLIAFEGSTIDGRIETQIAKLKQQMEMLT
jgi:flagellar assembly protein FliH